MRIKLMILLITGTLAACSQQNWYQGTQSALTAQCMKQPLAEYEDCNQPSKESYDDFKNSREQLKNQDNTGY